MEDKALIKKYESFLKLNHLNISKESASDFIDLEGMGSLMELSMEYVRKGLTMQSKVTKNKYFINKKTNMFFYIINFSSNRMIH